MKISFDVHLPFVLPYENGIKLVSAYPGAKYSLEFNTYDKAIIINNEMILEEKKCTVISVIVMPIEEFTKDVETDKILRDVVVNTINHLNVLFDALRIDQELDHIHNITIADFPMYIEMFIDEDESPYLYITKPQDIMSSEKKISKEYLMKSGSLMKLRDDHPQIFLVEKFYASAKSRLYREQFIEAIIDLQTSFEIFIRNTHHLILLKKGAKEEELKIASSIRFRKVIEKHIASEFNVKLGFSTSDTPIKDWYNKLYRIRNEIVHEGRVEISGYEAYEALDAYDSVRNYIADLLQNAGYLNDTGKVDLSIFKKNNESGVDYETVINNLKEQGIIDKDLEFINLKNK